MSRRALEPGQHTIESATPLKNQPKQPGKTVINWAWQPYSGGKRRFKTSGRTLGEAKARARQKLAELEAQSQGVAKTFSLSQRASLYFEQITYPAIENAQISEGSRKIYLRCAGILRSELGTLPLAQVLSAPTAAKTIEDLGRKHASVAKTAKTVLSNYVFRPAIALGLTISNPVPSLPLPKTAQKPKSERYTPNAQEISLTIEQMLDFYFSPHPLPGSVGPQGIKKASIAKQKQTALLTALQACTGLRIGEAIALKWKHFDATTFTLALTQTKTGIDRVIPIPHQRLRDLLKEKSEGKDPEQAIIERPTGGGAWTKDNANSAIRELFDGAGSLSPDLAFLHGLTSHVWRRALNTAVGAAVPAQLRSAFFGHSEEVNQRSYTARLDLGPLASALEAILTAE